MLLPTSAGISARRPSERVEIDAGVVVRPFSGAPTHSLPKQPDRDPDACDNQGERDAEIDLSIRGRRKREESHDRDEYAEDDQDRPHQPFQEEHRERPADRVGEDCPYERRVERTWRATAREATKGGACLCPVARSIDVAAERLGDDSLCGH